MLACQRSVERSDLLPGTTPQRTVLLAVGRSSCCCARAAITLTDAASFLFGALCSSAIPSRLAANPFLYVTRADDLDRAALSDCEEQDPPLGRRSPCPTDPPRHSCPPVWPLRFACGSRRALFCETRLQL